MPSISVVINTLNEEKNIERAIKSIGWADEIVIVDDGSTDKTLEIISGVRNPKLKVYKHKGSGYVEPSRNFALNKASGDWILLLDADEEILNTLAEELKKITSKVEQITFVNIPRKNIIFNKWVQNSFWWPDYNIRFFKKGTVKWSNKIHSKPQTEGIGLDLAVEEGLAIVHHNYDSISQFISRTDRYTSVQAKELIDQGYKFSWPDLIYKPLSEFSSRFFSNRGFKDGVHGLTLSLLQAFSFLIVYIKVWEAEKFKEQTIEFSEIKEISKNSAKEISYWLKYSNLSTQPFKRFVQKISNRLS